MIAVYSYDGDGDDDDNDDNNNDDDDNDNNDDSRWVFFHNLLTYLFTGLKSDE